MGFLANKQGCCITEIEIISVQEEIGKGSNGTIGAYVKQVKQEYINAKAYDRANISQQLKSAIKEEIDRFADNARENVTDELAAVERLNDELLGIVDGADETIRDLEKDLKSQRAVADKEIRHLGDELVKAVEKIESHKETIEQHKTDLAAYRAEISGANAREVNLIKQVGSLEADLATSRQLTAETVDKLNETLGKREEAERKMLLAEQSSAHHQNMIAHVTNQMKTLEQQINDLKIQVSNLTTQNDQLHEKIEATNRDRIDDLKATGNKRTGGSGKKRQTAGEEETGDNGAS
jgi:chromosome segregation ATPase